MASGNGKRLVINKAVRMVPLDELQVDPTYQREVKPRHKRIVTGFNEEALGVPLIAQREDGSLWIVDGLQRVTAVRALGWKEIRADVFASSGPEHESEIFTLVNMNRTRLSAKDEFKALLTAQDPVALQIKDCVEKCGFSIMMGGKSNGKDTQAKQISAINTLKMMFHECGPDSIPFALKTVKQSWPGDPQCTNSRMLEGMAMFFKRLEGQVDLKRLIPRLQSVTPQKILYAAGQTSFSGGKGLAVSVSQQIEKVYNKRYVKR